MTKQEKECEAIYHKFFNHIGNLCGLTYSQIRYRLAKGGVYSSIHFDYDKLVQVKMNCIKEYNTKHSDKPILEF